MLKVWCNSRICYKFVGVIVVGVEFDVVVVVIVLIIVVCIETVVVVILLQSGFRLSLLHMLC